MVFSSTVFLFAFLPVTLLGYYLIRRELRNAFLLVMSLLFYAAGEPRFVFVMMASIVANYLLGLLLWKSRTSKRFFRRILLLLTLVVNLGLLFYYKYYDFAISNFNRLLGSDLPLRHIALPIGISFFTFQGMSYVLDIYMGKAEVQKNPLNVALYIALFPQLIAGPIVRYSDVNKEIASRTENVDDFATGVQRFSVGLAKKVILSNNFALLADQAFGTAPDQLGVGLAWLGALAYTFQIYYDFSGYSDMAIGLGQMFGFHFRENFNYPYVSTDVSSFWRRWHISLSSWFRDYVYIPLGGNREGNVYLHLLIVFFLTGLWHGASWNFIVWGMWHGFFLIMERILRNRNIAIFSMPTALKWVYTMLVVVIGWVFFRASDLAAAVAYVRCMFSFFVHRDNLWTVFYFREYIVLLALGSLAAAPLIPGIEMKLKKKAEKICVIYDRNRDWLKLISCMFLMLASVGTLAVSTYNPFIYFNF